MHQDFYLAISRLNVEQDNAVKETGCLRRQPSTVSYSSRQTFFSTDGGADQRGFQCKCTAGHKTELSKPRHYFKNNSLLPVKIAALNAVLYI